MSKPRLTADLERDDDGTVHVLAPRVGRWQRIPSVGTLVAPDGEIGEWTVLGRRHALTLPSDSPVGRAEELPAPRSIDAEYGQRLFQIVPIAQLGVANAGDESSSAERDDSGLVIRAPTDGVWYRRPSPDVAPFVELGQRVRRGQPLGLVEVMKTFNQIVCDGPGIPDEAEVEDVRFEDGAEVTAGQVLVVLR